MKTPATDRTIPFAGADFEFDKSRQIGRAAQEKCTHKTKTKRNREGINKKQKAKNSGRICVYFENNRIFFKLTK